MGQPIEIADYDAVVSDIYEAALSPARWDVALTNLVGRFGRDFGDAQVMIVAGVNHRASFANVEQLRDWFNLTANIATYDGAQAGSLQMGALLSPHVALNIGVASGFNKRGKTAVRAGVTVGW